MMSTYQGRPCKLGHTERYASNRGCVTCVKVRSAAWYKANAKKRRTYFAAWSKTNAEKMRSLTAAWQKAHPEAVRANAARRRARKLNAPTVPFTQAELDAHLDRLGRKCVYCGGLFEHLDHVKPLALGGEHSLANLVPACAACNLSKGTKLLGAWLFGTDGETEHCGASAALKGRGIQIPLLLRSVP